MGYHIPLKGIKFDYSITYMNSRKLHYAVYS